MPWYLTTLSLIFAMNGGGIVNVTVLLPEIFSAVEEVFLVARM